MHAATHAATTHAYTRANHPSPAPASTPDTILDCDQLLVLSAGRLVEQGAPAELTRTGGLFARLVAAARSAGQALPPAAAQQQQ